MPSVGPLELVVILIIALVVFGPKRLPELGSSLGRGIREFRSSVSGSGDESEEKPDERRELRKPAGEESAAEAVEGEVLEDRHR